MNITGGQARRLRIDVPPGQLVRPSTDRMRESLFAILRDLLPGARVLDLFAGSGSLGLESASRGAAEVVWVEKHPPTAAYIERNLARLAPAGVTATLRVQVSPVHAWLARYRGEAFDLILADPPYQHFAEPVNFHEFLASVAASAAWSADSLLVVECERRNAQAAPEGWSLLRREDYGASALLFLENAPAD